MGEMAQPFFAVFFGALIVEAIVNIVKNIDDRNNDWRYWASLAVGILLGILVSVAYDIDLFRIAGLEGRWEWVAYLGAVLTGLIISRGANIVNDLLDKLNAWKSSRP